MKSLSLYEPANVTLFLGLSVRLSICPSVRCCGNSNLNILIGFLSDFIYGLLPSNSGSGLNTGQTNDDQDGRQNGHHLSVCTCGHSTLVIYYPIYSKFIYGLLPSNSGSSSNMHGLLQANDNLDGRQNGRRRSVPLLWSF